MVAIQKPSYSWWFDSHNSPRQSAWLTSALAELDGNTKAMVKLIEQNADSFAERAEMYYKKRPQLVDMVENFYRTHRSLAEQFDQLKSEPRQPTPQPQILIQSSPSFHSDDESEVDDPDEDAEEEEEEEEGSHPTALSVHRLKEENEGLKAQLAAKDEEKREVIRQLCLSIDLIKEENMELKKKIKKIATMDDEDGDDSQMKKKGFFWLFGRRNL